jgi:hypothetical protein
MSVSGSVLWLPLERPVILLSEPFARLREDSDPPMAKQLNYKKPRKINVVSVSIVLILLLIGYVTYKFLPLFLTRQEAYRVLDEYSSKFTGTSGRYMAVQAEMNQLKSKMNGELRRVGINDPNMETWIDTEPDGNEVRFGVIYSQFIDVPFGIIETQEEVNEIEITCTRLKQGMAWTCLASTEDSGQ